MKRSPIATVGRSLLVLIAAAIAGCARAPAPGSAAGPAPRADSRAVSPLAAQPAAPAPPAEALGLLGDLTPAQFRVLASSSHSRGDPSAPVTIVEFGDYDCSFCASEQPVLEKILADYQGRVRLVFLVYPLGHPHSVLFAEAARCAGEQGGFWKLHDYIFSHYGQLEDSRLGLYAASLGLDGEALTSCVASGRYRKSIESDHALARGLGVTGTPTFFVNGKVLDGIQDYAQFASVIDDALEAIAPPATRGGG